ncbi:MAG: hypothetical protein JW885_01835 [Deltaproteobacteria bacterium]|nr:hypothetical protein [Candidatus Zymogenaceae bacterium]
MKHTTFLRYIRFAALFAVIMICIAPVSLAGEAEVLTLLNTDSGLAGNRVYGLAPDVGFGIFIATNGGLHVFSDYVYLPIFQRMDALMITGGSGSTLWALIDEASLYRVRTDDDMWYAERITQPEETTKVTSMTSFDGSLFIATDTGLFYTSDTEDSYHPVLTNSGPVTAMTFAPDGTLALATTDTESRKPGLVILGGELFGRIGWVPECSDHEITSLFLTPDTLYVGTRDGELLHIDRTGVTRIYLSPEIFRSLHPGRINDIMVDEGRLYVAADNGLYIGDAGAAAVDIAFYGDAPLEGAFTCLSPGPGLSVWAGTADNGVYLITYRD